MKTRRKPTKRQKAIRDRRIWKEGMAGKLRVHQWLDKWRPGWRMERYNRILPMKTHLMTTPQAPYGKRKAPAIITDPQHAVAPELLAYHLVAMSEGIKKLLAGLIADDTLVLLIQHAAPTIPGPGYARVRVGLREIKAVLQGIEALAKVHLKPKKP